MFKLWVGFFVIVFLSACGSTHDFSKKKYLNLDRLNPSSLSPKEDVKAADDLNHPYLDDSVFISCDTITLLSGKQMICTIIEIQGKEVRFNNCPSPKGEYILALDQVQKISGGLFDRDKKEVLELEESPEAKAIKEADERRIKKEKKIERAREHPYRRGAIFLILATVCLGLGLLMLVFFLASIGLFVLGIYSISAQKNKEVPKEERRTRRIKTFTILAVVIAVLMGILFISGVIALASGYVF